MRILLICCFGTLFSLIACGGQQPQDKKEWWADMLTSEKTVLKSIAVQPKKEAELILDITGEQRIGLLVKQSDELRASGTGGRFVFLEQKSTRKYVETYYSASERFDLSLGTVFLVRNQSSIPVDVVVYLVKSDSAKPR